MRADTRQAGGRRHLRRTWTGRLALIAAASLAVSACGLRVDSGQVRLATGAAEGQGRGGGSGGGGGLGPAAGNSGGAATGTGGTTAGSSGAGPGGAAAGSSGSANGPGGTSSATTTPAGGNGGATDVGVTATSITVGNVSDLGGPVPGLFQGGPDGTQAYFDYINQTQGGVFGRKLQLKASDDGLTCNQNEASYQNLVSNVFAFVGSWSLDDNCGASQVMAQHPEVPLVQQALSPQMGNLPNEYSIAPFAYGANTGPFLYFKQKFPDVISQVGTLVGNQPAAVASAKGIQAAMQSVGYKIIYEDDFPAAQSNFTADVVRMRSQGVKEVFLQAVNAPDAADLSNEMAQQNWHPQLFHCPVCYFAGYISQSGGASNVEGQYLSVIQELFLGEDAGSVPEVALFDQWMKQSYPDFQVDQFAATSWANAALFVQALKSAGPHLTRKAVLSALAGTHSYSDNNMFPTTDVGAKTSGNCYILLEIKGGHYTRIDDPPTGFRCDGSFFHASD